MNPLLGGPTIISYLTVFPSSKLAAKTVDLECDNGWSLGAPCEGDAVKIGL